MSSDIIKKKYSISHNIVSNIFYCVRLSVPFTSICFTIPEQFIYHTTRGISFKDTAFKFQKIMKKEFNNAIKELDTNKMNK